MNKKRKRHKLRKDSRSCYVVMALLSILCILPLVLVLSTSLTDEVYIKQHGYALFPVEPSLSTYAFLLNNKGRMLIKAFGLTLLVTIIGTLYSVTITTCYAYAVTQDKSVFRFARPLSFFAWFTTIFSGGVLPWYILCTQYYGLKNNIFALFVPYGMTVMHMFILRGNFREVPAELIEAAKLDGASHAQIFTKVSIPLARAGITTISLFSVLRYWNDFYLPKWLITDSDYTTMQKLLYDMLTSTMELLKDASLMSSISAEAIPTETAKMAVAVMVIVPVVLMYPFGLKYFVKGINLGGVKG
ncbi:MAG: carbohydrate ABC transporter permease [Roseburia sp.]|nr:carbohydrate ABC transporter permease [Roseburia sp.]